MKKYLIIIQFKRSDFDDVDFFYSLKQQIYNNFVKQLYNYFISVNVIYIDNNIDITKKFYTLEEAIHHIKQVQINSGSLVFRIFKINDDFLERNQLL